MLLTLNLLLNSPLAPHLVWPIQPTLLSHHFSPHLSPFSLHVQILPAQSSSILNVIQGVSTLRLAKYTSFLPIHMLFYCFMSWEINPLLYCICLLGSLQEISHFAKQSIYLPCTHICLSQVVPFLRDTLKDKLELFHSFCCLQSNQWMIIIIFFTSFPPSDYQSSFPIWRHNYTTVTLALLTSPPLLAWRLPLTPAGYVLLTGKIDENTVLEIIFSNQKALSYPRNPSCYLHMGPIQFQFLFH